MWSKEQNWAARKAKKRKDEGPTCRSELLDPAPCCWLMTRSDINATRTLSFPGRASCRAWGWHSCCRAARSRVSEAMEQKGRRSVAFRLKERTGDGEVKAIHRGVRRVFFFFFFLTDASRSIGPRKGSAGKTTYCNDTAQVSWWRSYNTMFHLETMEKLLKQKKKVLKIKLNKLILTTGWKP